jgi:hypothetical protein
MNDTKTKRGCGERQPDSIYLESRLSPFGKELEYFLIDPPQPCHELGINWSRSYQVYQKPLTKQGEPVLDDNGKQVVINHLVDWVGEEHYPTIWDFIEETRKKGISRRINKDFDFSLLTPGKSQIFFAHKKARFDDERHEYGHPWKEIKPAERSRVTMLTPKNYYPPVEDISMDKAIMKGNRVVGDLKYTVEYDTKLDHSVSALKDGLFLRMPLTNIVYVRPADKKMLEKIKINNFDIEVVEE